MAGIADRNGWDLGDLAVKTAGYLAVLAYLVWLLRIALRAEQEMFAFVVGGMLAMWIVLRSAIFRRG